MKCFDKAPNNNVISLICAVHIHYLCSSKSQLSSYIPKALFDELCAVGKVWTTHPEQPSSHSSTDTLDALSVTGELRTWEVILDAYIQERLYWMVHIFHLGGIHSDF